MKTHHATELSVFGKTTLRKKTLCTISWIVLIAYVNLAIGCSYYGVNPLEPLSQESVIEQIQKKDKYIILHQGEKAWHLKDIIINDAGQEMKGNIEPVPSNHVYYKTAKKEHKANRYKKGHTNKNDLPIHEVHIYTTLSPEEQSSQVTIPFSAITRFEVYDTHVGATVFSALGFAAIAFGLAALIIVATKSSCPFVYIGDGENYTFTGEMYGGAIYPSLERDDYMPLPDCKPANGQYHIRISNELLERQYTNLANLMVVEHPLSASVIIDKNGGFQTITHPEHPTTTTTTTNKNVESLILKKDSISYLFNDDVNDGKNLSGLTLSFKKPKNAKAGKLILNAKNSFWLDYVYGKFNEQFGTYFNTFAEKQKKVKSQKLNQWSLDQNIPLSLFIETEGGWKFVDYFNSIGPLASRDVVMSIDLSEIKGEKVNIKLECGFMYWEIDYAAMDFTENIPVKVSQISSTSAIDERGNDVSSLIAATDNKYLIQPEIGNVASIQYSAYAPLDGNSQSVFLHSRGYYEYIRNYENMPNILTLQSFKDKGGFTKFSKNQYNEFISSKDLFSAALTKKNGN
jgi:hypothetical protein